MFFRILIILSCVAALVLVAVFRVPIATYLWDTTKSFPEALLMLSQDAALGIRMGDRYFDNPGGEVLYDIDRAERLYEQALAIDPAVPMGHYQRARIAFLRAEYDDALTHLDAQEALTGDSFIPVFYLRGLVQAFAGDTETALETMQQYYSYDSNSWFVHNNLAWLHFQLGNYKEMRSISARGLSRHPSNPWLLMNSGIAYLNLGDRARGRYFLDRAQEEAEQLTPSEWLRAYPGNDPQMAEQGLTEFLETLQQNRGLFHIE